MPQDKPSEFPIEILEDSTSDCSDNEEFHPIVAFFYDQIQTFPKKENGRRLILPIIFFNSEM
jgi:hypothetical protein